MNIFLTAFQRKDTDVTAFDEIKKRGFTLLAFSCGALSCLLTSTVYRGNEWICGYFLLLKIQNVAEDISAISSCGCAEAKNFRAWGETADAQVNLLCRSAGRAFSFSYLFILMQLCTLWEFLLVNPSAALQSWRCLRRWGKGFNDTLNCKWKLLVKYRWNWM